MIRATMWTRGALASLLVLALGGWEPLREIDPDVKRGNQAFREGRWDDAIAAYEAARGHGVDEAGIEYDVGTAKLRKADGMSGPDADTLREEALGHLAEAGKSKDPTVRSRASYNRGNVKMKEGKLEEAVEAYKESLRADASFDDARLNLKLALRKREKKKQQQQGQGQGQGQGQDGQQGQDQGQGQGQQGQQGQQPPQQGQGQGQQGQGQQGQQGQQPPQQGQGQGQQGQQGQQDPPPGQGQQGQQDPAPGQGQQPPTPPDAPQPGEPQAPEPPPQDPDAAPGQGQAPRRSEPAQPFDPSQRRQAPQASPPTPAEEKLQDLAREARRLRREQLRGRARDTTRMPSGEDW